MVEVFNLHGDEWDESQTRPGWQSREAWIGRRIGAEMIGASLYELEPGARLWPYHTHHANEEWLIILDGRPTLRTPDGDTGLKPGDVVAFRRGPAGLHQVRNDSDAAVRLVMLATEVYPEFIEYPDSGKYGATADGEGTLKVRSLAGEEVDYWLGEE